MSEPALSNRTEFLETLQGKVTALAGVVVAVGGLLAAIQGLLPKHESTTPQPSPTPVQFPLRKTRLFKWQTSFSW
jgi:hypothetical protein